MAGRDRYTVEYVTLKQAENGGWFAMAHRPEMGISDCMGAFTTKRDLLGWLDDNLRYATHQDETDEEKTEGPVGKEQW